MKKILFLFITILAFVIVFVTGCNDQGAGLLNTEPASSPALAAVSSDRGPFKVSVMKGDVKVEKELYPVEWDRASHPKSGIVYKFSNKKDILEALAYVCGSPERAKSFLRAVKSGKRKAPGRAKMAATAHNQTAWGMIERQWTSPETYDIMGYAATKPDPIANYVRHSFIARSAVQWYMYYWDYVNDSPAATYWADRDIPCTDISTSSFSGAAVWGGMNGYTEYEIVQETGFYDNYSPDPCDEGG